METAVNKSCACHLITDKILHYLTAPSALLKPISYQIYPGSQISVRNLCATCEFRQKAILNFCAFQTNGPKITTALIYITITNTLILPTINKRSTDNCHCFKVYNCQIDPFSDLPFIVVSHIR